MPERFRGRAWRRIAAALVSAAAAGVAGVAGGAASAAGADGVALMPMGDGWARNSVNVTIFRCDPVTTAGRDQYAAYYDPAGHVVVAHRTLGEPTWTETVTPLTGHVRDAHNVISIMADGDGYLHLSWDHHNDPLHYARSRSPGATAFDVMPMTGKAEGKVSYPEFFQLANGNLIFMYRDGASGNGNLVIDGYDTKTKAWRQIHANLISGEGKRNAYWETCVDGKGSIHVAWVWRESPNVASNHDVCYARSDDGGQTWVKTDGTRYQLPITVNTAEVAAPVPQKHDLMNQTSMCADSDGHPVIATYFRGPDDQSVQYYVIRFDGTAWQTMRASDRHSNFSLAGAGSKAVPMSRPQVLARNAGGKTGIWLLYRDSERGSKVTLSACPDLTRAAWTTTDLTDFSVGFWEPSYDHVRWQRDGVLDLFVQNAGQGDGETLQDVPPQKAQVLEWKP